MPEKTFKGHLVVNWKNGNMRVTKKKPTKLRASDIAIDLDITMEIPEKPKAKIKGRLKLSAEKIQEIVLEEI